MLLAEYVRCNLVYELFGDGTQRHRGGSLRRVQASFLPTCQVAILVVPLEGQGDVLVGERLGLRVEVGIYGGAARRGRLACPQTWTATGP